MNIISSNTVLNNSSSIEPALYIVATPIGNLQDISLRALNILKKTDHIACEDTRVSLKLLKSHDILHKQKLISYNDFSDSYDRKKIIDLLLAANSVALISDAGTPLISDPGYKLVVEAHKNNIKVISVPGACAAISALTVSGLPSDKFYFIGFISPKSLSRKNELKTYLNINCSLIIYESARRLVATLKDIKEVFNNPAICVAREITKIHEEAKTDRADIIINYYITNPPRGECVIIINNSIADKSYSPENIELLINKYLSNNSAKDTAALVANITGLPKKQIYDLIIKLKNDEKS